MSTLSRIKNSLAANIIFYLCWSVMLLAGLGVISREKEFTMWSALKFGAMQASLAALRYFWARKENDTSGKKKAESVE